MTATTYHNYYQVLENDTIEEKDPDIAAVGAIGGGFNHTSELIPIKFKEAMTRPDKNECLKSVQRKYELMVW